MILKKKYLSVLIGGILCLPSTMVMAQESIENESATSKDKSSEKSGKAKEDFAGLEVISITSQKRPENVQKVGLSVNAFNEEALDKAGIQDISRLELVTPGLSFAQRGNDFKPTIRGANSENTFRDNSPPIGMFVDGLYKSRAGQAASAFLDVQSVEVLKGPQGTLFGKNTLGGAINVITNKPDSSDVDFGLNLTYGNFDQTKRDGFFNLPVSDNFAVRIAFADNTQDGFIKNLGEGGDLGAVDDSSFRLSALWDISDDIQLLVSAYSFESGGSALGAFGYQSRGTLRDPATGKTDNNGVHDPINPRAGSLGARADLGPWQIYRDTEYLRDVSEDVYMVQLNWAFDTVEFKSITSHTEFYNFAQADGDYSENHFQVESYTEAVKAFTQEFQLKSTDGGDLKWVTGLYYSAEEYDQTYQKSAFSGEIANDGSKRPATGGCAGQAYASAPDTTAPVNCPTFTGNGRPENVTIGAFVHATYNFTDATRLTVGARYNKDDKTYSTVNDLVGTVPEESESWSKTTFKLGLEQDIMEDSMAYASYSTGFLSGGFNTNRTTFDQQEVTAYEIGIKNRFFDNLVQLNVAAYMNDFDELLASKLITDASTGAVITVQDNAGKIKSKGIEIDFKSLPSENSYVNATLTWQDSKYGDFLLANRFDLGSNTPAAAGNTIQLRGETTPWAPTLSSSISAGYYIETDGMGMFTPHLQLSYSGEHYTTGNQQFDLAKQDAYVKVDFRVYWQSNDDNWTAQAFVENLTDEVVLHHTIIGGNDIIQSSWSKPRMYGVKVGYRF